MLRALLVRVLAICARCLRSLQRLFSPGHREKRPDDIYPLW
jgi:hypothetical protein